MRHGKAGDKLGVLPAHRKALLRSLALSLIEHERIQTTPRRAKAVRPLAERIITLAKGESLGSRRRIIQLLGATVTHDGSNRIRLAVARVYNEFVPRFKDRNGGYTQIFRLTTRRAGDNAEQCLMQYIPAPEKKREKKEKPKKKITPAEDKETKKVQTKNG